MTLTDLLSEKEWNDFVKDLHEKFSLCCDVSDVEGAHGCSCESL